MHIVELPCARAAARLSWVSSRSSGSSFESAYGTHAWVDALCLPENLEGLPRGLQDQRQAAIDSLRASLTEGRASRSELAPVRTSLSPGPPGSAPNSAASGPSSSQNGRTVAAPLGRVPLADWIPTAILGLSRMEPAQCLGICPRCIQKMWPVVPRGMTAMGKGWGWAGSQRVALVA